MSTVRFLQVYLHVECARMWGCSHMSGCGDVLHVTASGFGGVFATRLGCVVMAALLRQDTWQACISLGCSAQDWKGSARSDVTHDHVNLI
jgi:hypothetical protein